MTAGTPEPIAWMQVALGSAAPLAVASAGGPARDVVASPDASRSAASGDRVRSDCGAA